MIKYLFFILVTFAYSQKVAQIWRFTGVDTVAPGAGTVTATMLSGDSLNATFNHVGASTCNIYLKDEDNADSVLFYSGVSTNVSDSIPLDLKWAANDTLFVYKYSFDAAGNRSSDVFTTILPSYFTIWADTSTLSYATIYRYPADSVAGMEDSSITSTFRVWYEDWDISKWNSDSVGFAISDVNASDTSWYQVVYGDTVSPSEWKQYPEKGEDSGGGGSGTVAFDSYSSANINGTSLSINVPSGTSDGDILICTVSSDVDQTITLPTGWTLISELTNSSHRQSCAYKIASGESGSYTFTVATTTGITGLVSNFTKTSGTWDVSNYTTTIADAATITSSSIDISAGSVLYLSGSSDGSYIVEPYPTDMTFIVSEYISSVDANGFYEQYSTAETGVTKTTTYNVSENLAVIALEIKAE